MNKYEATELLKDRILEAIEWGRNGDTPGDQDDTLALEDIAHEQLMRFVNENLIYTADIVALWTDLGYPEPSEYARDLMDAAATIIYDMTAAIYTVFCEDGTHLDALDQAINEFYAAHGLDLTDARQDWPTWCDLRDAEGN